STGEGRFAAIIARSPDPAEGYRETLSGLAEQTAGATEGRGALGGSLGPASGGQLRAVLATLDERLEGARNGDPGAGTLLSTDTAGRKQLDEAATKIQDVLKDM